MPEFAGITLAGWRQFSNVDIYFDSPVCVLTGPNGCGKTTILNVLGRHFGWNINFISTPYISKRSEKKFWSDVDGAIERSFGIDEDNERNQVGTIRYSDGTECQLFVPKTEQAQYNLKYAHQSQVEGINIPSHRPVASYYRIESIPTNPKTNQQQFQEFQSLLQQVYGSDNVRNPGIALKQSLMALAVFGYGNAAVQPNPEYIRLFDGFQGVLRTLLPKSLGFQRLEVRNPEIVLVTDTGQFPLDAMSGGISAIFGMAWQIFMYGADKSSCTVLIDEPENHLHPSMQREFLPSLRRAFPHYRFIVATHSPFVVSSAADGSVYALMYDEAAGIGPINHRKIRSKRLVDASLAGSTNRILQEILDVPSTLPIWVEEKVENILNRYGSDGPDQNAAANAYRELRELGVLGDLAQLPKRSGEV